MANTYTQINIHVVFATAGRETILKKEIRERLFSYLAGTIKGLGLFPLAVNGSKDHVHLFFELNPDKSLSKVVQEIKSNSSKWINDNRLLPGHFSWQKGYGGFSYSRSQRNDVIRYIMNQEKHHAKRSFKEEYLELLSKFEIDFDDNYLFEFYD
jgi:REP element-mobilizing transposase RayT